MQPWLQRPREIAVREKVLANAMLKLLKLVHAEDGQTSVHCLSPAERSGIAGPLLAPISTEV